MIDAADDFDANELTELFGGVVGKAQSDGGLVSVSVDNKGRVARVVIDEKLSGTPVDRLADAIAIVCAKAFDDRVEALSEVIEDCQRRHGLGPDVLSFLRASVNSLKVAGADSPPSSEASTSPAQQQRTPDITTDVDEDDSALGVLLNDPLGRRRQH